MDFKSLFNFQKYFKTNDDYLEFLKNGIFPNGVCCIQCQSNHNKKVRFLNRIFYVPAQN